MSYVDVITIGYASCVSLSRDEFGSPGERESASLVVGYDILLLYDCIGLDSDLDACRSSYSRSFKEPPGLKISVSTFGEYQSKIL